MSKRVLAIGRIKTLEDAARAIDSLVAALNTLATENEQLKAQIAALQPINS